MARTSQRFVLVWTETFTRTARKFLRKHPELATTLHNLLQQLENDPLAPHLRLHNLSGKLQGIQSVRLTYAYRRLLMLKIAAHEVILIDIGTHDEVY